MKFEYDGRRFYLNDENGKSIAEIEFSESDTILIIASTSIDDSLRGQGIGVKLVDAVVELARKKGKKVMPLCPYANRVFHRTPEYEDIWFK